MGLSGLWHGAAWTYVVWGLGHGLLVWLSRQAGLDQRWRPRSAWHDLLSRVATVTSVVVLFACFRATSMTWLVEAVASGLAPGDPALRAGEAREAGRMLLHAAAFAAPWTLHYLLERRATSVTPSADRRAAIAGRLLLAWRWILFGVLCGLLVQMGRDGSRPFIYFQF